MYHISYQDQDVTIRAFGKTLEEAVENLATKLQESASRAADRAWTLDRAAVEVSSKR